MSAAALAGPEVYAADALEALYEGARPWPPLTWDQESALLRSGFIARRYSSFAGHHLVLTAKGEDLVADIRAERAWIAAHGVRA